MSLMKLNNPLVRKNCMIEVAKYDWTFHKKLMLKSYVNGQEITVNFISSYFLTFDLGCF